MERKSEIGRQIEGLGEFYEETIRQELYAGAYRGASKYYELVNKSRAWQLLWHQGESYRHQVLLEMSREARNANPCLDIIGAEAAMRIIAEQVTLAGRFYTTPEIASFISAALVDLRDLAGQEESQAAI